MFPEYPRYIYHPEKEAHVIERGPIPPGWYKTPADFPAVAENKEQEHQEAQEVPTEGPKRRGRKPSR